MHRIESMTRHLILNQTGFVSNTSFVISFSTLLCISFKLLLAFERKVSYIDFSIAPSACPAMECFKECEHGYALDNQGCSTCRCRDPCEDIKCPNEGEVCKVVSEYFLI